MPKKHQENCALLCCKSKSDHKNLFLANDYETCHNRWLVYRENGIIRSHADAVQLVSPSPERMVFLFILQTIKKICKFELDKSIDIKLKQKFFSFSTANGRRRRTKKTKTREEQNSSNEMPNEETRENSKFSQRIRNFRNSKHRLKKSNSRFRKAKAEVNGHAINAYA